MEEIKLAWRGSFEDDEVNRLHAEAFDHEPFADNWNDLVSNHSLGWVTGRADDDLVGFANVIWDGQIHA